MALHEKSLKTLFPILNKGAIEMCNLFESLIGSGERQIFESIKNCTLKIALGKKLLFYFDVI